MYAVDVISLVYAAAREFNNRQVPCGAHCAIKLENIQKLQFLQRIKVHHSFEFVFYFLALCGSFFEMTNVFERFLYFGQFCGAVLFYDEGRGRFGSFKVNDGSSC